LKKTGYYHDYLEGSKPHQQLQAKAKDFYTNNLSGSNQSSEDYLSRDLKNLLKTVHVNVDKLVEESKDLPIDDGKLGLYLSIGIYLMNQFEWNFCIIQR